MENENVNIKVNKIDADKLHELRNNSWVRLPENFAAEMPRFLMDTAVNIYRMSKKSEAEKILDSLKGKTLAILEVNGKPVAQEMLRLRGNGAALANLKGAGNKFGQYMDIRVVDLPNGLQGAETMRAGVGAGASATAFAAVAVAAVVVKYRADLKRDLKDIQAGIASIINYLETDKQSLMKSDYDLLQDVLYNIDSCRDNPNQLHIYLNHLSSVQENSKHNIQFYKDRLQKQYDMFISKGKKDKDLLQQVQSSFYGYRLSLQAYSFSRMVGLLATERYDAYSIKQVTEDLNGLATGYEDLYSKFYLAISGKELIKFSRRIKHGLAIGVEGMGSVLAKTPLKKTPIDDVLIKAGKKADNRILDKADDLAQSILEQAKADFIFEYIESIKCFELLESETIEIMTDGEKMYVKMPEVQVRV